MNERWFPQINTAGLAGGLTMPYKGILPAALVRAHEAAVSRPLFPPAAKAAYFLDLSTGSPVNGSMYSLMLI